jgi:hypothetical protein
MMLGLQAQPAHGDLQATPGIHAVTQGHAHLGVVVRLFGDHHLHDGGVGGVRLEHLGVRDGHENVDLRDVGLPQDIDLARGKG